MFRENGVSLIMIKIIDILKLSNTITLGPPHSIHGCMEPKGVERSNNRLSAIMLTSEPSTRAMEFRYGQYGDH